MAGEVKQGNEGTRERRNQGIGIADAKPFVWKVTRDRHLTFSAGAMLARRATMLGHEKDRCL